MPGVAVGQPSLGVAVDRPSPGVSAGATAHTEIHFQWVCKPAIDGNAIGVTARPSALCARGRQPQQKPFSDQPLGFPVPCALSTFLSTGWTNFLFWECTFRGSCTFRGLAGRRVSSSGVVLSTRWTKSGNRRLQNMTIGQCEVSAPLFLFWSVWPSSEWVSAKFSPSFLIRQVLQNLPD